MDGRAKEAEFEFHVRRVALVNVHWDAEHKQCSVTVDGELFDGFGYPASSRKKAREFADLLQLTLDENPGTPVGEVLEVLSVEAEEG